MLGATLDPISRKTALAPSKAKAYYTVGVLTLIYAFSYLDRQLPSLLLQSIKTDLRLTDTEVSLLTGLPFAIFFSISALPLSALADRWSRKGVIGWGIVLWGGATAVCGAASTFFQFCVARMGVGLGESALTPTSYSLIADLFAAGRRARPMAVFTLGAAIGTGMAMLAGAGAIKLAEHLRQALPALFGTIAAWKIVLGGTGLLTITLLPLVLLIADPQREADDPSGAISFGKVFQVIWRDRRAYLPILVGIPFVNTAGYGFNAWVPALFIRTHGWSVAQTGLGLGISGIIGGLIGSVLGGAHADRLGRRSPVVPLLICIVAVAGCTISTTLISVVSSPGVQLALTVVEHVFAFPIGVMGAACLQDIAPPFARARVASIYVMIAGLVGVGLGPTMIGATADFIFRNENMVGQSMALAWR